MANVTTPRPAITDALRVILGLVGSFAFAAWAFVVNNAAEVVKSELGLLRSSIHAHSELGAHDRADERIRSLERQIQDNVIINREEFKELGQRVQRLERAKD